MISENGETMMVDSMDLPEIVEKKVMKKKEMLKNIINLLLLGIICIQLFSCAIYEKVDIEAIKVYSKELKKENDHIVGYKHVSVHGQIFFKFYVENDVMIDDLEVTSEEILDFFSDDDLLNEIRSEHLEEYNIIKYNDVPSIWIEFIENRSHEALYYYENNVEMSFDDNRKVQYLYGEWRRN